MTQRCPACGAAVPDGADWCSLCYVDLRVPATVSAGSTDAELTSRAMEHRDAPDPLTAPLSQLVGAEVAEPVAAGAESVAVRAERVQPVPASWPCAGCGADVPLAADVCDHCGTGFLGDSHSRLLVQLPVVGDVTAMTQNQRLILGLLVAVGLTAALFLIAYIGGYLL